MLQTYFLPQVPMDLLECLAWPGPEQVNDMSCEVQIFLEKGRCRVRGPVPNVEGEGRWPAPGEVLGRELG